MRWFWLLLARSARKRHKLWLDDARILTGSNSDYCVRQAVAAEQKALFYERQAARRFSV